MLLKVNYTKYYIRVSTESCYNDVTGDQHVSTLFVFHGRLLILPFVTYFTTIYIYFSKVAMKVSLLCQSAYELLIYSSVSDNYLSLKTIHGLSLVYAYPSPLPVSYIQSVSPLSHQFLISTLYLYLSHTHTHTVA